MKPKIVKHFVVFFQCFLEAINSTEWLLSCFNRNIAVLLDAGSCRDKASHDDIFL
jgi:hypothetical protein